jgi:hypothetical protein
MSLLTDLLNLEKAVTASPRSAKDIWAAIKIVGDDFLGGAAPLTFAGHDDEKELKACCDRIMTACAPRAGEEAIGDGKILQAVMQLLPIILSLFGL